ncbi:hypothetical protein PG994_000014 [Apiospora phragmitis]|uniref:Uncharacterized protein n=1 Tax=Apiospora phragmitis TaxID=2905665 RepID=A0ABR1X572_9PEZI
MGFRPGSSSRRGETLTESTLAAYILLEHSADPREITCEGWTLLHSPSTRKREEYSMKPGKGQAVALNETLVKMHVVPPSQTLWLCHRPGPQPSVGTSRIWGVRYSRGSPGASVSDR